MRRTALALAVALPLALLTEAWALLTLLSVDRALEPAELIFILGLHLVSAVSVAEGLRLRYPPATPEGNGAWRMGLVLSLVIPALGLLISVVLLLRPCRAVALEEEEALSPMEYRTAQAHAERAAEAELETADGSVEALGDALKDRNKERRLGAVEALRGMENKEAVELLGKSLDNTVFEVRYHAVEALTSLNKKYSQRIAVATDTALKDPSPSNHRVLGEVYHEYASLEMEDPSIQQHLLRCALENLERSILPGFPTPVGTRVKLGWCHEQLGELDRALEKYQSVVDEIPYQAEALLGIARLQFRQARFGPLAATCRRILELGVSLEEADAMTAVSYWAKEPDNGEGA